MMKFFAIVLSLSLLFSGCSSKNAKISTPSQAQSSDTHESSFGERVLAGTLVAGAAMLYLTTAAVVILLLVPKAQSGR